MASVRTTWCPFRGLAHVAYLPGGRLHGFGRIARLVDAIGHRFTYQEWMTRDIAEALVAHGKARRRRLRRRGRTAVPAARRRSARRRTGDHPGLQRRLRELRTGAQRVPARHRRKDAVSAFTREHVAIDARQYIVARFFAPPGDAKAAVLVVPAMGVTQAFYAPFAEWLAAQGYLVATFDFRGIGQSRHGRLKGLKVDVLDWARQDCAAMIDAVAARLGERPLYWVGHSLGGQILPFVPNRRRVSRIVTVATGSGYWRENTAALRRTSWWLWFVAAPLSLRLFGYFPGRRLRKVGDLPRGVMEQWRRWCLNPEYAVGVEGESARALYAAVDTPIVSFSFTDDEYMSLRNTESIHGQYVNAPRTLRRIAPKDIGEKRIGHFGFFRSRFERSLWREHLLPALS
jgi:predicted alpha/beta hydrolase